MSTIQAATAAIADVLRAQRFRYANEIELQDGIAAAFAAAGIDARREVPLSSTDKIDFLAGAVGVEVKIASTPAAVRRQLTRYARSLQVAELVLVTTRSAHRSLPPVIGGKPLHVVWLSGVIR